MWGLVLDQHRLLKYLVLGALTGVASSPLSATALIVNGDFSQGNTGFSSDYAYEPGGQGIFTNPGQYGITKDPSNGSSTGYTNNYLSVTDHTSGGGYALLFDGTNSGDFWRETVALKANKTYTFKYFATTPDGGSPSGDDLADIQFRVNNASVGDALITSQGGSPWQHISYSFKTGAAGTYTVALGDLNGTGEDNDDLIDDLSLKKHSKSKPSAFAHGVRAMLPDAPGVPEPASWVTMLLGFGVLGFSLRRDRVAISFG